MQCCAAICAVSWKNTPALTGGEGIKKAGWGGGGGEDFFFSEVTSFEDIVSAILSLIVGKKSE